MKITIVTPSYNQGQYLEQTIDSVLSQNYANLEYIILDGGSTDQTLSIIKKYEKYLTYWVSGSDSGQSDAINKGLSLSTGDIFNWLNSDDYYEPGALHKVAKAFQNEEVKVVCGRSRLFHDNDITIKYSRGTDVYKFNLAKSIGWARIDQPETFFKKSALDKIGPLNMSMHYVMDKEWWIRYLLAFGLSGIKRIDDVLVNFRLHGTSKTVSQKHGFEGESHSLFFKLAGYFGLGSEQKILEEIAEHKIINFDLRFSEINLDSKHIYASIHYYLLYKADLFYYRHQRELSQFCLQHIDKAVLDQNDLNLYNKLKFRNKYFPVSLSKLTRD